MTTLSFIGLGTMGGPMVRNLRRADYTVYIYDLNPTAMQELTDQTGAKPLDGPSAAPDSDAVILMLPNSAVVASVLGEPDDPAGLANNLPLGSLIVDMGSSDPDRTRSTAARLQSAGLRFVDAPVSGGPVRAAAGDLTIMVGGQSDDVEEIRPILQSLGSSITYTGPVGSAHALKALNNLLSAVGMVAALEILAVGIRFGLDPHVMLDVINTSTGRNHATEVKIGQQVLSRRWNVGFSLALTVKDIQTALSLADTQGVTTPVSAAAVDVCRRALESLRQEGSANPDQSEIARYLEHLNALSYGDAAPS